MVTLQCVNVANAAGPTAAVVSGYNLESNSLGDNGFSSHWVESFFKVSEIVPVY
jgi:hypothetical protein